MSVTSDPVGARPRASALAGPLVGIRIVEFVGVGPGPLCGMLMADLGAEVIRIDRIEPSGLGISRPARFDLLLRGKRTLCMDLKQPAGLALARALVSKADGLIEGFRPQTMERLQLGPEACLQNNPRLIYGRVTGFGQDGPLAQAAGHDLNYIALSGALHGIGRAGAPPTPPLNLLGDYAGGSMFLAFGMVSAMLHARSTGAGQVVDAAMIDGVSALMTPFYGLHAAGIHDGPRGCNLLDSGAPYYDVYCCADGEYVSIAPIETKFQQILLDKLHLAGVDVSDWPDFEDRSSWSVLRGCFETTFAQRSRDDWCAVLEGSDACFAPVLSAREAPRHPHNQARRGFIDLDGITQPAPAPRFSATPASELPLPLGPHADAREWARAWGIAEIDLAAAVRED